MGLADFTTKIVATYKADTSPMRRELKKLEGAEKKRREAVISAAEAHNGAIDGMIKKYGMYVAGIGAAVGAWMGARKAMESYFETARLEQATAAADMDRLKEVTRGLVPEIELLKFAQKGLNSDFKATQKELENVLRLGMNLADDGEHLTEVLTMLGDAMAKGVTEELKNIGLILTDPRTGMGVSAGLKSYNALAERAAQATDDWSLPMEDAQRSMVELQDALRDLTDALGWLAAHTIPHVVNAFKDLGSDISSVMGKINSLGQDIDHFAVRSWRKLTGTLEEQPLGPAFAKAAELAITEAMERAQDEAERLAARAELGPRFNVWDMLIFKPHDQWLKDAPKRKAEAKRRLAEMLKETAEVQRELEALMRTTFTPKPLKMSAELETFIAPQPFPSIIPDVERMRTQMDEAMRMGDEMIREWQAQYEGQQTLLERIFGKPDDFAIYASMFDTLGNAVTGAFDAWITGSESIGKAFRRAVAEGARALASDMALQALKHTAWAIGQAAFQNWPAAALHAKAAAAFAAGALAAGGVAKAMGAGGGAAPRAGAGAGASPGVGRGAGAPAGKTETVVIISSDFAGDRMELANRTRAALDAAEQEKGSNRTVSFG